MNEAQTIRPESETEEETNLLELLRVVVRNLPLIAKITAGAIIVSVLFSLMLKNVYTAKATLLPPQKESVGGASALLASMGGGIAGLSGGLGSPAELYLEILKSRSVADAVIKRLDLPREFKTKNADATRTRLLGVVKFQAAKTGIISITADYKDPVKAALFANTFVDELQKKSLQLNMTKAGTERSFLEKRIAVVKQDLKSAEDDMKSFQEKNKTIKADSQAAVAIESIAKLKAELVTNEVRLAALRNSMTDESADVRTLLTVVTKLKSQLNSMSGSGDVGGVIPSVGNAPSIGVEYVRRLRELKTQEVLFEQLTKQLELAKISEARDSSSLQVLDEAVVPLRKSKPKRALIVILATVTAFFCSIFWVFIKEYLAKLSPEDSAIMDEMKNTLKGLLRIRLPRFKRG